MSMPEWNMPWLLLLALQPITVIVLRLLFERNKLNQYAQFNLQPWVRAPHKTHHVNYSLLRNISYWLAWILLAIAAAGPRIAEDIPNHLSQHGKDIMLVLDISQSMHASDIKPNRLRQAHRKIAYLNSALPDDRIGLIVYAAKPHLYIPMTHDKEAIEFYLRNLDYLTPPSQGSRPSLAIKLANEVLTNPQLPNKQRAKYILHITDADTDDKETSSLNEILPVLQKTQTPLYTLIMASNKGEAVPAFKEGWLNINGHPVVSRPNTTLHKNNSKKTGGKLYLSHDRHLEINTFIDDIKEHQGFSNNHKATTKTSWNELFPIFLITGILCLMISMSPYKLSLTRSSKTVSFTIVFVLFSLFPSIDAIASQTDKHQRAYQALLNKEYLKARQLYAAINDFSGNYGEAVATYRLGDYSRAIRLFEQTILNAQSDTDYTNTLYNLGNSYFQIGNFRHAVNSYQSALLYDPHHQASQHNLAYAKKAILAVEKRTKTLSTTSRAGRGPRSARAADNITLTDNNNVSLDSSESTLIDDGNSEANSTIDIPEFIVLRGLNFANKSTSNNSSRRQIDVKNISTSTIQKQINQLHDDQASLWKRIFEIEEGYPAPLEEPSTNPGVTPW